MRCLFTLLALLGCLAPLSGQRDNNVVTNFYKQLILFSQEKVYVLTDKASYVAGEHIWFRAFLTDALTHRQDSPKSRYVYVDLIDPNGHIIKNHKIRPDSSGVFHNRMELDENLAEGNYMLRAYTAYMRARPDYLFEKIIFIANPASLKIDAEPSFSFEGDNQVSVSFQFRNAQDNSLLPVTSVGVKIGNAELQEFPARRNISFRPNPEDKYLYVSFSHNQQKYAKYLPIPAKKEDSFDVSFFPEGGYLVADGLSKVGFKALRSDGLSEEISGDIFDAQDRHVGSIQSLHAGMGSFLLMPEAGNSYYAICSNKDSLRLRFALPEVQTKASVLQVQRRNNQILISVQGQGAQKNQERFLVAHIRGSVLYADKMPTGNMLALQTLGLPPGIIQILLLDKDMNPLSERLVFNRPQDWATAELTPHQPAYGNRALVKMDIQLKLPEGYENEGSFALSVTDDHDLLPDSCMTIASYLLLSSELRGHIEDAGYYLQDLPQAGEALDALMLTQGWRRYDIPAVIKGQLEEPQAYVEGGMELSGSVKELISGRPAQGVSVFVMAPDKNYIQELKSDKTGRFYHSGFEFPDSTRYIVSAHTQNNRRVALSVDSLEPALAAKSFAAMQKQKDLRFDAYVAKADQKYIDEEGIRSYELIEAVVTAQKPVEGRSIYASQIVERPVAQDLIEKNKLDIVAILKQVPGITLSPPNAPEYVSFRPDPGRNPEPALLVVDNVVMRGLPIDVLSGIPIKRIELMKPPVSYMFGIDGAQGAILITTDTEAAYTPAYTPHMVSLTPLGYKQAAEFYAPVYETSAQRSAGKADRRTTIFWKPNVQITDGKASVEFYTADTPNTTYSAVLEGITANGVVVRQIGKIAVRFP